MITYTVEALPEITAAEQKTLWEVPRTAEAHRALLAKTPAMNAVQIGGTAAHSVLPAKPTVAAWNVERCLFPEDTATHLNTVSPDIVLLSEVDHGMSRTGQRHTTEDMAAVLGMQYAFGVEFHELDLGGPTERQFCKDSFNRLGWHGNAILSSVPFKRVGMIRLDQDGYWFAADAGASDPDQPRLGGRMALAAIVPTEDGPLCVVSTHLESNANAAHRHTQFADLLAAVEEFAPDMPILIGGDLNTGNHIPPDFDWKRETLFDLAETQGYSWEFTAEGMTTRPSLITPHPDRVMKLDWFTGRGLHCDQKGILPSLDATKRPLSDHDCVWCSVSLKHSQPE